MPKTWVQLGRLGDIMCVLPILLDLANKGERQKLMVAREYAPLLDGVGYIDPVIYEGPHYEIAKACQQLGGDYISTQTNGPKEQVLEHTYKPFGQDRARSTSFVKEMWRVAGYKDRWDECLPLVFDRRSPERETKLLAEHGFLRRGKQKKLMLVSTNGNSSPFPWTELLMELLQGRFGKTHRIMELPKAERIFDLLCLYERADVLVSTDSAPLHLAWATPHLRVVALVNDKPSLWNGSPWRPNHVSYCRYGDFPQRAVEVLNDIEYAKQWDWIKPKVLRIWNAYDNPNSGHPITCCSFPIRKGMCGRDSTHHGETKAVPFLKDCLRMALQKDAEFVCVTHPEAKLESSKQLIEHEACYAYRYQKDGENLVFQPTVDLFCARKEWWKVHLEEIPDFFLGRDYWWTHGLRGTFARYGAVDITGVTYKERSQGSAKEPVKHPLPVRIRHNKDLAEAYMAHCPVYSRYPKVSQQVEVLASFSGTLRNGYNPSLVDHDGQTLMVLRYHPVDTPATSLMLVTLKPDFSLDNTMPIELEGASVEDPKWFRWNDKLYMSWVQSSWPDQPPKSVVKYAMYEYETFQNITLPPLPNNDWSGMCKNLVFLESQGHLQCLYHLQPSTIFQLDGSSWRPETTSWSPGFESYPRWPYGTIRGGSNPVDYEGKWLRFFHGHLDNEFGMWSRRYYVGALLMEKEPPFNITRVSKKPILYGSEIDDLKISQRPRHFKANVVFPGSCVARDGYWALPVGVNDCASLIVKIEPNRLNF